jgi:uncharacterized protein (TIGR02001 family)
MKKLMLISALVVAAAPFVVRAEDEKKPEPEYTFTGNAGLFSDYRFRGYTQTGYGPAFQGGADFAHKSGFYIGNWNSNVEQGAFNGATLEMDFYGGYKHDFGPVGLDVGYYYYYYPRSGAQGTTRIDNGEIYFGGSAGPVSAKVYYSTTSFFGLGKSSSPSVDTKGSWYFDLSGSYEVIPHLTLLGHYGYQKIENGKAVPLPEDAVSDWKLGVSYDLSGWALGAALIGTSKEKEFLTAQSGGSEGAGKTGVVLSVSKTF